ncbi:putative mini-chromosome maintenance complex protein 7 [Mycosarcoma maydis]|uniref:DNA replication licensing factor MCM7 n=1 Tax=Mycosarcoma maydis TaxID=5270 RepID=A0A0D1DNS0_MYCMD|nr:putative mini-chromosome maintenance complex protein 7 [Ustilago maydis 521]KIS65701.1 putative mini-chromosome maintenance complex protein 7 [Ustilago maydis 521]|eukprot:XP_011392688.1 putative mini-chromosome maintenance complex protein 7 [Ustilago maydis 521]
MSASAPILPTISLGINYDDERAKITDFLLFFKAPASRLASLSSTQAGGAPVSLVDADQDQDDLNIDHDLSGALDRMDVDRPASQRRSRATAEASGSGSHQVPFYMHQLQNIANREQDSLVIDLNDLASHSNTTTGESGKSLVGAIRNNAKRYLDLFCECVDALVPEPSKDISHKDDVLDVIRHQRMERNARTVESAEDADDGGVERQDASESMFPPVLLRRYTLYFKPYTGRLNAGEQAEQPLAVRNVRGSHMGKLITVRGIVTRVSEVKPFLLVDAYACDVCGAEVFQEVTSRQYMPLSQCNSRRCLTNNTRSPLYPQVRASKFVRFQEVKIQEMADQVPVGHIPRTMTIHVYGPLTRAMNPGDVVDVGGIFLPMPYSGFKAIRAGLLTDTYLDAQNIHQLKKQYTAMQRTREIAAQIAELKDDPALYQKLASSIAPEIYGHEDVKKCLLLLLVGGVSKSVGDGMKIRGDINVCLMGDPGVAKSQLLKYISKVAPRGVYTTGRGSSGVGLTAAVMRDPVTDEMVLEGGALVLADNGIACIDEFDKMEESDRTAIHEVMEQQTISISKAGITTTLNARTSILAAANPLYGRYNPRVSPVDNINLPAALLSRFDILYLILDTPSRDDDERLAHHVTYVHMHNSAPELEFDVISPTLMRHYIALARQKRPVLSALVSDYVVGAYVHLRSQYKEDHSSSSNPTSSATGYVSARTLLGIIRLSQALARLRFDDHVSIADVDEALRLLQVSKSSILDHQSLASTHTHDSSYISKIYRIIREFYHTHRHSLHSQDEDQPDSPPTSALDGVNLSDVRARIIAAGFVEDQFQECLNEYQDLGVLHVTANRLLFL